MNKGKIVSIDGFTATVMTEDCQLKNIQAQPDMTVGKEIYMKDAQNTKETTNGTSKFRGAWKPLLVAAGVAVILIAGLFAGKVYVQNKVFAHISVDVNPSIEFAINRDLEVISVKALNAEAEKMLDGQDFAGMAWRDAVEQWLETLRASNEFQIENVLISAVLPENAEALQAQIVSLEGAGEVGTVNGLAVRVIYTNDENVANEAQNNGLSVGRQMLLNQSIAQNLEWNKENIEKAQLGNLVQALIGEGEQNQTKLTQKTTEGSQNQSGDPTGTGIMETNKETNGSQQNGESSNQEKSTEMNGETSGSGVGTQETVRQTLQTQQTPSGVTNQSAEPSGEAGAA